MALQFEFPSMGSVVTIGHLMMASGDVPEGRWESEGTRELGCASLDDSLGPEVLALLARVRCAQLSGREKAASGVVGVLRVSYLHWGGFEGTPPSEDGMIGASGAWDVESHRENALGLGSRDSEELVGLL